MLATSQGSGCSSCTERGTISYTYDNQGHALSRTDENGHTPEWVLQGGNHQKSGHSDDETRHAQRRCLKDLRHSGVNYSKVRSREKRDLKRPTNPAWGVKLRMAKPLFAGTVARVIESRLPTVS